MAEFTANATSLVGNFSGPCLIYLNGESITIRHTNKLEIAKWPYVVIRQFRAEEEAGRFSFVSGRRGPYGVAEYNFMLSKNMLNDLQDALTQFTGAKFSNVAPGSGSGENPPPVPTSYRPPNPSPLIPSVSMTSLNSVGSSTLSASYERGRNSWDINASYSRGGQAPLLTGPRLPPRDYLPPSHEMSSLIRPENTRYVPSPSGTPPTHPENGKNIRSLSGTTRNAYSTSDIPEYNTLPERPPKPLPSSPLTPSHVHEHYSSPLHTSQVMKSIAYERAPPLKPRNDVGNGVVGQSLSPPSKEQVVIPKPPSKPATSLSPPADRKPYNDRLSLSQEEELSQGSTNHPNVLDSSNLDFGRRNSPLLRPRSHTPEEAKLHHLHSVDEEGEIVINKSPTIRGRRSPQDNFKQAQTERMITPPLTGIDTYSVLPKRLSKQHSADELDISHYHHPKPTSNSEYGVPRPYDDPRNVRDYYHQPSPAHQTYQVPIPYTPNGTDTYDSPRHVPKPVDQLYSSPKSVGESTTDYYGNIPSTDSQPKQEDFYNVPRTTVAGSTESGGLSHQSPGNVYNLLPRRVNSGKTIYNTTDGGSLGKFHQLRSAKSLESLVSRRIHRTSSPVEPPASNEHNMYVEIEQKPAISTADNLYAEIPANHIPHKVQLAGDTNQSTSAVPQPSLYSSPTHYDQLPSRMGSQIQKQRELARKGYELCLPAEVDPNSLHADTLPLRTKHSSASPPPIRKDRGTSLVDILIPGVKPSRPRSEADLLDSFEYQKPGFKNMDTLGSSIPTENTFTTDSSDEYVIVTRSDTRPKFEPAAPQVVPGVTSGDYSSNQNEEYQVMSAVKINRSQLLYDTPNPSSSQNGLPNNSPANSAPEYGNVSHETSNLIQEAQYEPVNPVDGPKSSHSKQNHVQDSQYEPIANTPIISLGTSNLINDAHYEPVNTRPGSVDRSSVDMEGTSHKHSRTLEQLKHISLGSLGSVFSDEEVEGQSDHIMTVESLQKTRIRTASGSPKDVSLSVELKNRTRSMDNVLDTDTPKKNNYINISTSHVSSHTLKQKPHSSTLTTTTIKKRPQPLPKPASFDATVKGEAPNKGRHGYESVDISRVKGNDHPLSSSTPEISQ